ncbi:ComEC/Rec2 family competence protein [Fundidesulfovibrio butyratiphilus]
MPPVLLPWQALFFAYACGIWCLAAPWAGGLGVALTIVCNHLAGRSVPRPAFFLLAALAGLGWAWVRLPAVADLPPWLDERGRGRLDARVVSVREKPDNRLEILLDRLRYTRKNGLRADLPGLLVWTWQNPGPRPNAGDAVSLLARPKVAAGYDNAGEMGWGWRWRLRGVFLRAYTLGPQEARVEERAPPSRVEVWRQALRADILRAAGSGSAGGMVLGLVTGERFAVSPADLDMVRRASLSHLLAVSGMNLTAVVALAWISAWLAGLVWPGLYLVAPRPKLVVALSLPLVLAYLWLANFEPSLVRASLMFASWGALILVGRSRVALEGLFLALAAMLVFDPLQAFEVGLLLSAGAVAGLVLLLPLGGAFLRRLAGQGLAGRALALVSGWALVTLAAQIGVLPVQAGVFGEAGWHLYLNLLWVPVVEWLAQPPAYVGALCVTWLPAVGDPLLALSAKVCGLMLDHLSFLDSRGLLTVHPVLRPWPPETFGFLVLGGTLAWARGLSRRRLAAFLALGLALLLGPWAWRAGQDRADRVELTVLDVGQAQAVVLVLPGGRRVLVDGAGSASPGFDPGRAVVGQALTWGRPPALYGLVMSHPDTDHAGGIPFLLTAFHPTFFASHGERPTGELDRRLQRALAGATLTPELWSAGQRVDLAPDVWFEVLSPPPGPLDNSNDASLVLRLVWRGRGLAVLPGDSGRSVLEALAASGGDCSARVLLAPHHGSRTALAPNFYRAVGAGWAFVSSGQGNSFGLPAETVVRAMERAGMRLLGTARCGAITAVWDSPDAAPRVVTRKPCAGCREETGAPVSLR